MEINKEMPKAYEPGRYENDIYKTWEESGVFNPDNLENTTGKYCNVLPPPNANGELHIGHASGYTVMDLFGRYQRKLGKKTLLLPGKDHAGIQSQVVYEKKIKKERGIGRHDLGREKFYQEIYDFCIDRSQYMRNQERKLGLSADWGREKFTLDPKIVNEVLHTFVKMYHEVDDLGNRMVYRGERIINWCPRCASALSDMEVEHEEKIAKLWTFRYDKNFPILIATSRPETKLGDTAVAVNPDDDRYKEYVGKTLTADFCGQKLEIRIIADRNIDMNFGTGALGVTPAHSMTDYQLAMENDLPIIKVIDEEAKIKDGFGKFSGMDASVARNEVVEELKKRGLLEKEEDYPNNLSVCERCKTSIEPLMSKQWFVNVNHSSFSLRDQARPVIENGEIKIYPERFKKVMLDWIEGLRDWCISRQIWWGPRIPAWYRGDETYVGLEAPEGDGWVQDEDTFDTWFSSGQWAYNTLGLGQKDFEEYYPSDTMIMGRDILPFWAFRMIILSLFRTGQPPFKNLYFTGLVRDENGQKMSKSKGNGIEPLEMIEKYGTDAVRMSLVIGSAPGNDMNLGENKIAGFRNFINKIWNIARFVQTSYPSNEMQLKNEISSSDAWILQKMRSLIEGVNHDLDNYLFSVAGERLRDFAWDDLADWYLEVAKFEKTENKAVIINKILRDLLGLLHPFVPFVTEAIWSELGNKQLIIEPWPTTAWYDEALGDSKDNRFEIVKDIISAVRNARSENQVEPTKKVKAVVYTSENLDFLLTQINIIKSLRTGIEEIEIKASGDKIDNAIYTTVSGIEIYLLGAVDAEKETARLEKEIANLEKIIASVVAKLSNEEFVSRAPAAVVEKEKEKMNAWQDEVGKMKERLGQL